MILYLDASALVKRYVMEAGSQEVAKAIAASEVVGTSLVSRAETSASLAKAVRVGALSDEEAEGAVRLLRNDWPNLVRVRITENVVARADLLAWQHGLRGYDAVQLASALVWRDSMQREVVFGTYDRQLWRAGGQVGMTLFPEAFD